MSEYTQVGVRTQAAQAQPSSLTSTSLGPLYGAKSPLLSQMRGMGGLYRPPYDLQNYFVTVPHGGSVLRLYCALLADDSTFRAYLFEGDAEGRPGSRAREVVQGFFVEARFDGRGRSGSCRTGRQD